MNKKQLTEADIRTKFITPALDRDKRGKWDLMTQLREEFAFTHGRVVVRGKTVRRGEVKKVDYLLYYKPNLPMAVIEAKDNRHSIGTGCSSLTAGHIRGVGVKHRHLDMLRGLELALPPLPEQRRIVAKVDQLMALVDQLEAQLVDSRAKAAALLEAVVAELSAA